MLPPDFALSPAGPVSRQLLAQGPATFAAAAELVRQLPYGRTTDPHDLAAPLREQRGTCSSKHALLQQLADEHGFTELRLVVGIFNMHERNTPAVGATLRQHGLAYLPEAHCYLTWQGQRLDYTRPGATDFEADLVAEREFAPAELAAGKVPYHQHYLRNWLASLDARGLSLWQLWRIREQCIADLAG